MRHITFLLLIVLLSFQASAQYFQWNAFITSADGTLSSANYLHMSANPEGGCAVQTYTTSFGWPDYNDIYIDSSNIPLWNPAHTNKNIPCYTTYDKKGHRLMMVPDDQTSDYHLVYYRDTDTLQLTVFNMGIPDADTLGNIYIYVTSNNSPDFVEVYNSSGNLINVIYQNYVTAACDPSGNIYLGGSYDTIYKYQNNGTLLSQFYGKKDFYITSNGNLWYRDNANIYGVNTGGVFTSVPVVVTGSQSVAFAADNGGTLYIWSGGSLKKFSGGTEVWSVYPEATTILDIDLDDSGNLYYVGKFVENEASNTLLDIPPSLYDYWPVYENGYPDVELIYAGKISSDSIGLSATIKNVEISNGYLCTGKKITVKLECQLPLLFAVDTIYIELSDTSGGFSNPLIIGKGFGNGIFCAVPDTVTVSDNYLIRARYGDSLYITVPYVNSIKIRRSPDAPLILENSVFGNQSCLPLTLKTNSSSGLDYSWMNMADPDPDISEINFLGVNDSVLIMQDNFQPYYRVIVEDANGCSRQSASLNVQEIDGSPTNITIPLRDTLYINDPPVLLGFSYDDFRPFSGNGIVDTVSGNNTYFFFNPSLAQQGWNIIKREIPHTGTPCIPYENYKYVYVAPAPDIMLDTVSNTTDYCPGDSLNLTFSLSGSTIYNAGNIFYAELIKDNSFTIIGQDTDTTINCVLPLSGNNFQFRIRSSQTGKVSAFNPDGKKNIVQMSMMFSEFDTSSQCIALNHPFNIYPYNGIADVLRNDTLIGTYYNYFTFNPDTAGVYSFTVSNNSCILKYGPYTATNVVPPMVDILPGSNVSLCNGSIPQLYVHPDPGISYNWYLDQNYISSDTLISVYEPGQYILKATTPGCALTSYDSKTVSMAVELNADISINLEICEGDSAWLRAIYGDSVVWYNSLHQVRALQSNYFEKDTGTYYAIATSALGCTDTSEMVRVKYRIPSEIMTPVGTLNISTGNTINLTYANTLGNALQWYQFNNPIPGETNDIYTASQAGTYFVSITDSTGCAALSPRVTLRRQYRQNYPSDVADRTGGDVSDNTITIFPNPTNDIITLQINAPSEQLKISIRDITGRLIMSFSNAATSYQYKKEMDVSSLSSGMYQLEVFQDGTISKHPLIISR